MSEVQEAGQPAIVDDGAVPGEFPDPADEEVFQWAQAVSRKSIAATNDALKSISTLSTALLAGSVAFIQPNAMPGWAKAVGCSFMLLTLAVSLIGGFPRSVKLDPYYFDVEVVRAKRDSIQLWKTRCLWAATVLLILSFAFFLLGILFR